MENKYKMVCYEGKVIQEHRVIMEKYLGRKLTKDEVVHHINRKRYDNRIENLQVMNKIEHCKLPRILDNHTEPLPTTNIRMSKEMKIKGED